MTNATKLHYFKAKVNEIFTQKLQEEGYRLTKARLWLVNFFTNSDHPISIANLLLQMEDSGLIVNKTTAYRELAFLTERGLIQPSMMSDGLIVYESRMGHHHHLVCRECQRIVHVDLGALEQELLASESWLSSKGYKQIEHSLEFSGVCQNCKG